MAHGFKFRIGDMVGYTLGQDYRVIGRSGLGAGDFYALQKGAGEIYIREGKGLTLVPDPKLEAAKKVIEKHDQYLTASNEYEVARTAFVKLTGKATQPIYEAGRVVQQADSQKESN